MKTVAINLGMIFFLMGKIVIAGTDIESPGISSSTSFSETYLKYLSPVTPKEATFDDLVQTETHASSKISLEPTTPGTAAFDDLPPVTLSTSELIIRLAPRMPVEVDFFDPLPNEPEKIDLRPHAPNVADFE